MMPTLVDDGFILWESRAIMIYLIEKYGKSTSLYPSDPKARAVVNQRLFFDMGTLYQRILDYYYSQVVDKTPADPKKFKKLEEAVNFFNTFLDGQTYAVRQLELFQSIFCNKISKSNDNLIDSFVGR